MHGVGNVHHCSRRHLLYVGNSHPCSWHCAWTVENVQTLITSDHDSRCPMNGFENGFRVFWRHLLGICGSSQWFTNGVGNMGDLLTFSWCVGSSLIKIEGKERRSLERKRREGEDRSCCRHCAPTAVPLLSSATALPYFGKFKTSLS